MGSPIDVLRLTDDERSRVHGLGDETRRLARGHARLVRVALFTVGVVAPAFAFGSDAGASSGVVVAVWSVLSVLSALLMVLLARQGTLLAPMSGRLVRLAAREGADPAVLEEVLDDLRRFYAIDLAATALWLVVAIALALLAVAPEGGAG